VQPILKNAALHEKQILESLGDVQSKALKVILQKLILKA
jgi:hypothetical protein